MLFCFWKSPKTFTLVTINIKEFGGYDIDEFKEFLIAQNANEFKITLPKEGVLFYSAHNELAREFAIAAYIGQRLSEISSEFKYYSAPLADLGEFTFEIETKKLNELAGILHFLSAGYGNSEFSEPLDLSSEVASFIKENKDLDKVVCTDLLETYFEYYKEDEDETE